jgi:hypothetical protein
VSRFAGRRFALVELDTLTEDYFDGHVIYAFEVKPSPVTLRLRRWVHVALFGWS